MPSSGPPIDPADRVAVVAMGSPQRSDDAAGLAIARRLPDASDRLLVVEGGVAPENYTGVVRRFEPDWVVFVDAVALGEPPGTARWVDPEDLAAESFSSHKSTPGMVATFLARETGADVTLFGVQPADVERGTALSSAVESRLEDLAGQLADALGVEPVGPE